MEKKPKIFFIGSFKRLWDEEGIARALEGLGCHVHRFEETRWDQREFDFKVDTIHPNIVLMAKLKIPAQRVAMIRRLRDLWIPTASWTFDLYLGLNREHMLRTDPIFRAEYVFTPDGGNHKKIRGMGINHHVLRQGVFGGFCHRGGATKLPLDVAFVGCENPEWIYRTEMCAFLAKNYSRFHWFGRYNTQEVRGEELNDLVASTKIMIGDSVYAPYYWSNRIYELLGRGAFLISPMVPGLEKDYKPYKHFIPYTIGQFDELKEKIDYFLNRPEERRKISEAAMAHTRRRHTLENRCRKLLGIVKI